MVDDFKQPIATLHKDNDTILSTDTGYPILGKKGTVYSFLEIDPTSGGLKVDLDYSDDEVTVWGSSDGGTTRHAIKTDINGQLLTINVPPKTYVNSFIGQQVNTVLITPTIGKKLKIYGVQIDSSATNACCAAFNFVSSTGTLVWRIFFDKAKGVQSWMPLNILGGINESLVLNTTAFNTGTEMFVCVAYDEVT